MVVKDHALYEIGKQMISPFDADKVSSICYDLSVSAFCPGAGVDSKSITLAPYESVFVKSKEVINLPNNILANVVLRNSRIRQGLQIAAPVYQPGHRTHVFYRITNISKSNIVLTDKDEIAAIVFDRLDGDVDHPYSGAFSEEMDFSGMGRYTSDLSKEMTDLEQKVDDIKHLERNIYSNVLSILAVFVAVFSLINVNIGTVFSNVETILVINLIMIGSIGFLIATINAILDGKNKNVIWCASIIAFLSAIIVHIVL